MARKSGESVRVGAAEWSRRLERLKQSGLSIREFAEREGLKAGSLSFWKWKLAQGSGRSTVPLRFVELTTEVWKGQPKAAGDFEVVLRSGREVRVASGFDAGELARLVGVLEEVRS